MIICSNTRIYFYDVTLNRSKHPGYNGLVRGILEDSTVLPVDIMKVIFMRYIEIVIKQVMNMHDSRLLILHF